MIKKTFYLLKLIFIPCQRNKYRPKLLENKFLFYYAVVLLFLKIVIIPFFLCFPETSFFASLTKIQLIEFTNTARQSFGLLPLKENPQLNEAAYLKAKDMVAKGYFAHYSPEGLSPWFWLKNIGYNYKLAGENLAIGFLESEQVHYAWMNSPSHKKNILNPNYQEIGIAVLKDNFQGSETTMVVQYFGTPKELILPEKALPADVLTKEETLETPVITGETKKEQPIEEKILREVGNVQGKEGVFGQTKEVISTAPEEILKETPAFLLFQFILSDYYNLIQKIIYGSLAFIIFSLLLTFFYDLFIYRKFEIQYKDIIFKGIGFSALWFVLIFLDKLIIVQMAAYNFRIN